MTTLPRRNLSLLRATLLLVALAGFSPNGFSQPASTNAPVPPPELLDQVEGNWEVTASDNPEQGKTLVYLFSLRKERQLTLNGRPFLRGDSFQTGKGSTWNQIRLDAGEWAGQRPGSIGYSPAGTFSITGYWGSVSTFRPVSTNEMRGDWKYNGRTGQEIWRRMPARITSIEYVALTTNRVALGETGRLYERYDPGDGMRGNKREFHIRILGDNFWGYHYGWVDGTDVEAYWVNPIYGEKTGKPENIIGITVSGCVWSRVTPGIKRLRLDEFTIPFELALEGFPQDAVDLEWLVTDAFGLERTANAAPVGSAVRLRARSIGAPGADRREATVRILRADGKVVELKVPVYRTGDTVLDSRSLRLLAGPAATTNILQVLGGDRIEAVLNRGLASLAVVAPEQKLRFVERLADGSYVTAVEPLVFGTSVYLEARIAAPNRESRMTVDVSWTAGQTEPIEVEMTPEDSLLYRSKEIRLLPPARRTR